MPSTAYENFLHAIQDSVDLMQHFDALNKQPPPPEIEVLKRASLVMGLAALETYIEDRVTEEVSKTCSNSKTDDHLKSFYIKSLETDLKSFHSPTVERIKFIFSKYLNIDITENWSWNNCNPEQAKIELNKLVRKRGDIAHRSLRPTPGLPVAHAVTRDDLRKSIHFLKELAKSIEKNLEQKIA